MNDDQSSSSECHLYRCVIARLMGPIEASGGIKPVVKVVWNLRKR